MSAAATLVDRIGSRDIAVVTDPWPNGPRSALRTTVRAWSSTPPGATHRLVLHDDMVPCSGFWAAAQEAVELLPDAALALCAFWNSRNGAAVRLGAVQGLRWVRAVNEYTPCTALILPVAVGLGYAEFAERAGDAWHEDVLMYRYLKLTGIPTYLSVPSLAEHQDMRSLSGNDFHGLRNAACVVSDARWLPPAADATPQPFAAVPFLKFGASRCAVPDPETPGAWQTVGTERYLARLGIGTAALRRVAPKQSAVTAELRGVWLTGYAMGMVARLQRDVPRPPHHDSNWADLVHTAISTIAPGGCCERLPPDQLVELRERSAPLAIAALEAGLCGAGTESVRLTGGGLGTPPTRRVAVVGGVPFPGRQVRLGLTDLGYDVQSFDELPNVPSGLAAAVGIVDLSGLFGVASDVAANAAATSRAARLITIGPDARAHGWRLKRTEVYGPGMPLDSLVVQLVVQALMNRPIVLDTDPDTEIGLLHVDDLVSAVHSALLATRPGEGAVPVQMPLRELAWLVATVVRPTTVVDDRGGAVSRPTSGRSPVVRDQPVHRLADRLRWLGQWLAYDSEVSLRAPELAPNTAVR
jgi:hypothetical protein